MDLHQLKTFSAVARERTITRASERLHLSQPAVSAHIKALEDALGLTLFERTPKGMRLTEDGQRLLLKAEETLGAHQELVAEAARIKGRVAGRLRLGASASSSHEMAGRLVARLSAGSPEIEVALEHGSSRDILDRVRNGTLDAGFYNEGGEPDAALTAIEVGRFATYVVAPPGLAAGATAADWRRLAEQPWIFPAASACCGRAAESIFAAHHIRPRRVISVDRETMTRSLVAGGLGVGLLHAETALDASARGEVALIAEAPAKVCVRFAHLATRAADPVLTLVRSILREAV